jgi:hypothetical protein
VAANLAVAENIPIKNDRFSDSIAGDHIVAEETLPLENINKPKNKKNEQRNTSSR